VEYFIFPKIRYCFNIYRNCCNRPRGLDLEVYYNNSCVLQQFLLRKL